MAYPITQTKMLVNSVNTSTTVSLVEGMQVAKVSFLNAAGQVGQITLSPLQPQAENVEFKTGTQTVKIALIKFAAQFGFDNGKVTVSGDATDQEGKNDSPFNKEIANWS
ncbi:hypothetical protein A4H97_14115 [Niastella yeongjuensis]|uniref:Uncharacterized protein n=1 Tax=Niastella yeongjuensis TaxID=354355 RepID=A0A1V9E3W3_9BACT|nr:hypothetical protein [Niastella yeongjuensis]OQP40751.1 hypothetical protein A4H97_14115 [Niastella yeongjuensis]SEP02778.1 hypothetical protein SAMN05660816_04233 [Niastella yeongjuensis]